MMAMWQAFRGHSTLLASSQSFFRGASLHVWMLFFSSSCLFASELTSWVQDHAVRPSLCLCVPTLPHLSSYNLSLCWPVCIAIAHSILQALPPPSSNSLQILTWFHRSAQRESLNTSAVSAILSMTALLSLLMSKSHSNSNFLLSQIFGMHVTVCSILLFWIIQDITGTLLCCGSLRIVQLNTLTKLCIYTAYCFGNTEI